MTLIDLAYGYQRNFIENYKKRKIWVASRQVGKSWSIAMILAKKALSRKNGLAVCISTNSRSASEIITKCKQFAESIKILSDGRIDFQSSYDAIKFSQGSRILSLPSTADSLRGWSAQCVVCDECAYIRNLDEILQSIAPTLTRDPESELILTTTPAGRNGPFWDLYCKALDDPEWYVQHTTIEDAICDGLNVDLDNLHSLCPDPDVFAQEYMCKFTGTYSQMIDLGLLDYYDDLPTGSYVDYLGVDVGSTSDRTAMVTVKMSQDICYVDDIVIMHNASYQDQLAQVQLLHNDHNYRGGYVDKTGIGSAFAEFVSSKVSSKIQGLQFTGSNKTPMIETLRSYIFDHKIKFNRKFQQMIELDLSNMQRVITDNGDVRYDAGHNQYGHSDITSAIILALKSIKDNPASISVPIGYMPQSAFGRMTSRLV